MNETNQISALETLTEVARAREPQRTERLASIRVSPGAYLAVASVITFLSALLLQSERDVWALVCLGVAWLLVPTLAFADRISFDGDRLTREGPLPYLMQFLSGARRHLRVADFEKVDTHAVRTLRRGGRVRYRYRTQITGKGMNFSFASGGKSFREMVRQLYPLIHDDKLDARTRDLRDYLSDPQSLNGEVRSLQLASPEVLDEATADFKLPAAKSADGQMELSDAANLERARQLRQLANRLRISGRLREAGEGFRRALNVIPKDGWLIYEFARLLRSQASAQSDAKLLSRSRAALRLAELRSANDSRLLTFIGESFLECGEVERAQRSFRRAMESGAANFRAHVGLADVALRTGKLAHVIHQYRDAASAATEKSLQLYARREADYYARLNDDDNYLATELRRINWLQHTLRVRRLAARVTNASILIAIVGTYLDETISGIGWALASSSILAWVSSLFLTKSLGTRRKPNSSE